MNIGWHPPKIYNASDYQEKKSPASITLAFLGNTA
jgi:hypothetical protein